MKEKASVPVSDSKNEQGTSDVKKIIVTPKPFYSFFKRFFDILISFITLSVLLIPMLVLALIIVIDSPGASPIYSQERVGKNGKRFRFYKFRSMVPKADEMLDSLMDKNEMDGPAFKIKDDPRITRIGKFIRSSSIDELPQFWNVLKGDMSIVGPRPPLPREVAEYTDTQMQRLMVTPGITGYWQIQPKRNDLSFDQWLELDLKYIEERSLKTDFVVVLKTIKAVCGLEGV